MQRDEEPDPVSVHLGLIPGQAKEASEVPSFSWAPPDLSEGSPWHQARIRSLKIAARNYPNPNDIIAEGIHILDRHRQNYDDNGPRPTKLQLIWWEFPSEHWEALRLGSPMNFLMEPARVIHDNAQMDEEQLRVATEFVEELIDL